MLKLKVQYFGHLMRTAWCWERLRAEGEKGVRRCDGWTASPMQWIWTLANFRSWWNTDTPGVLQSMGLQSRTWLGNWTTAANQWWPKCTFPGCEFLCAFMTLICKLKQKSFLFQTLYVHCNMFSSWCVRDEYTFWVLALCQYINMYKTYLP